MKKMTKRALSLVLTLAMILSLGVLPASAAGIDEGEEIDAAYPAQQFSYYEPGGLNIDVKAPAGALPRGTTMEVSRLANLAPVQDAVDRAADLDGAVVLAADINFWHDGEEVEPVEGSKILVTMTAPEIAEVFDPVVVHVPDGDPAVAERIDPIVDDSLDIVAMGDQISFEAEKFSVYAVIGGSTGDEARVEVNFYNNHLQGDKKVVTLYVKNSDTAAEIDTIVYDPGIGEILPSGLIFLGWSIDDPNANTAVEGKDYDTAHYGADYTINTHAYSIDGIRDYLEALSITEGMDPVNVYAMVAMVYTVTYEDPDGITLATDNLLADLPAAGQPNPAVPYTIRTNYSATDQTHNFEGWNVKSGASNISNASFTDENNVTTTEPPYPLGTTMDISGDVVFSVIMSEGHWLVFEENGSGATYNAPVFIREGQKATRPRLEMVRPGYTFDGWWTGAPASEGADPTGTEYVFDENGEGQELTDRLVLYAKWIVSPTANYTVIVWQQSVTDDKNAADAAKTYDFAFSVQVENTPSNTAVSDLNLSAYQGLAGNASYTVDGKTYSFYGFKYNNTQTAKEGSGYKTIGNGVVASSETVLPNGTTVINIYYDRELVTYTFNVLTLKEVTPKPTGSALNNGEYYIKYNNQDCVIRFRRINWGTNQYYIYSPTTSNSGDQYAYINGTWTELTYRYSSTYGGYAWYYDDGNYYYRYSGIRYVQTSNTFTALDSYTVYSYQWEARDPIFTGLYGQKLSKYGYTWPTDYRWMNGINSSYFTSVMDMFGSSVNENPTDEFTSNFYGEVITPNTAVYHFLQNVDGSYPSSPNFTIPTIVGNGMVFRNFQGFTASEFRIKLPSGVSTYTTGTSYNGNNLVNPVSHTTTSGGWTDWLPYGTGVEYTGNTNHETDRWAVTEGGIEFRYTRDQFDLTYMVGRFVDRNNAMLDPPVTGTLKTEKDIPYESSLASYGAYDPGDHTGFVFAGWYIDETCTTPADFATMTMPLNGVIVYAKWQQIEYRVFLHPNVPKSDNTLDWGSNTQATNFRISYNGKVSVPTGRRTGYLFIGWYTDAEFNNAFNPDTHLTDTTVPETPVYDKTVDMTDNANGTAVNKWGILDDAGMNKDVDRFWITRKLDLYAKWSAIIIGAEGIGVVYDPNTEGGGKANTEPEDTRLYGDNVKAVAQAASTPADEDTMQFLYWVLQKWDPAQNKFVDMSGSKLYPGDTFTVLLENTRREDRLDEHGDPMFDENNDPLYVYTVQLRAEYGPKEVETPTHIYWYANNETTGVQKDENIQINKGVDIPTTETWTNSTRGGSGLTYEGHEFLGWARLETTDTLDPATLGYDDLFLRWVEDGANDAGGYYVAQDDNGDWVPVTQVACDERTPYHNMYAVWAKVFYVYHTGTNKVEKVVINNSTVTETNGTTARTPVTFNLAGRTSAGFLYGGYYTDYAGKGASFDATGLLLWQQGAPTGVTVDTAASSPDALGWVSYTTDTAGVAYAGPADADPFAGATAYTVSGLNMVPEAGVVYYLKEVPDVYLRSVVRYTYFYNEEESIGS
ncbi:MAG: InlB B-repeat-containing protein, partial [Oscillospiraceae bacterium]|nr:InlB B-repeat-containing protein [Oscillospiraceae bacterium]